MAKTPWFRFYSETRTDPKMLMLSDTEFRLWANLLCLANESDERGVIRLRPGVGYPLAALAKALYVEEDTLRAALIKFESVDFSMVEIGEEGAITITHFLERQYDKPSDKPDAVKERVRRFRGQEDGVTDVECNADETPMKRDCNATYTDTDPDTETEKERGGTGESELPPTLQDLTPTERSLLSLLREIYPTVYKYPVDLEFIRKLAVTFPGVNLAEEAENWKLWLTTAKHRPKNVRLAFRNWCKKSQQFRTRDSPPPPDIVPARPERRNTPADPSALSELNALIAKVVK
jgi:hypothetical protein